MSNQTAQLLLRKNNEIETRPMYVEEWLDSLPYLDFVTTSNLMHESLKAINKTSMKPAQRMELVKLYNRPYQYYVDSQVKTGAHHTLQSMETMTGQVNSMKFIAMDMALACRIAMNDTLNHRSLWGQNKPPMEAGLKEIHYLSHALIFSYLGYSPSPKNAWHELYSVFDFAFGMEKHNSQIKLENSNNKNTTTTIENTFKRIILASLADPHHLPFGAIWEIYEKLEDWASNSHLDKFHEIKDSESKFVINLKSDTKPIPYNKFNIKNASNSHMLLDASSLLNVVKQQRQAIKSGQSDSNEQVLSPYYAETLLDTMVAFWGTPTLRRNQRKPDSGIVNISCGINSIYFYLNDQIEFNMPRQSTDEVNDIAEITNIPRPSDDVTPHYEIDEWYRVDTSNSGLALSHDGKPSTMLRVGDLLGIHQSSDKNQLQVGIIRWLMVRQNNYKIGIQIMGRQISAVAVRAIEGPRNDCEFRRGILIDDLTPEGKTSIITSRGLFAPDRALELVREGKKRAITSNHLIESTANIEKFHFD